METGIPRLSQLPAITGLPAQKIDAPELKSSASGRVKTGSRM